MADMTLNDDLIFRQIEIGPMANFVYIIGSKATREAAIIDPAWQVRDLVKIAEEDDLRITKILVTHTHPDHVGGEFGGQSIEGVAELLDLCKAKVYVHKSEVPYFKSIPSSEIVSTDEHTSIDRGTHPVPNVSNCRTGWFRAIPCSSAPADGAICRAAVRRISTSA